MSDARLVKLLSAKVEDLSAECDTLRAELAAEREKSERWQKRVGELAAEGDATLSDNRALRELLREARDFLNLDLALHVALSARIDAALVKGGGDENG